jgi:DUF917 family protein
MRKLTKYDLDCLAIGSAILGSGGGGDPTYDIWMAKYQMDRHGPVTLLDVSELETDALVVPLAFMGAPLVSIEMIPSGREFIQMFPILEQTLGRSATVLMAAEIGGGNAFTPLSAACQLGLPVLDADTIGRAFPELQMSSCHLHGISPGPAFVTDCFGNTVAVHAHNSLTLEKLARQATIAMGSSSAVALYLMSGQQAIRATVHGSVSKGIEIGRVFLEAQAQKNSPVDAILSLTGGKRLGVGKITDIQQIVEQGFLIGNVMIQNGHQQWKMTYQNEYLIASCQDQILATTPDILMLFEQDTGRPITSESLQFGLQVELVALPAPPLWQTPQGLALVGPKAFGLDIPYTPIQGGAKSC